MSTATAIGPSISNGGKRIIDMTIPYRVEVEIKGEADLLFHRWNCEAVEAKAKAAKDADARLAKADAEISSKVAASEAELAKATAKALAGIEAVAADAAADIVAKVSGAKVTSAQAATAVKAVMSHG